MRYEHYQYGRSHLWEFVGSRGTFVALRLWRFSGKRPALEVRGSASGMWMWLVERLPRRLVYFAGIALAAHATSGEYGNQEVPALTLMDALDRWDRRQ